MSDRAVVTVIALAFVVMLGLGLVLPILPLFARSFGVSYAAAGLLVSATGITRLAFDIVGGSVVDRMGERMVGALGLIVLAVCALATAFAPTYPLAVLAWGIGGAGASLLFAAQYSYLLKVVPKKSMARTLGIFYGAFNAGVIAGGVAGGLLADAFGLASPLVAYSGILFVAVLLYLRFIEDPKRSSPPDGEVREGGHQLGTLGRLGELFRTGGFITAIVLNFGYLWFVAAVFDTLVPLYARESLGMSTAGVGAMFAIAIATEFCILYPAGVIADRRGRKIVLVPAFAALALITGLLGFATSIMLFAIGMGVLGIASGFAGVPPAAVLADVVPESSSGIGVGAFRFAGDLAFVLGPVLTGATIGGFGFPAAFALTAVPLLIAFAAVVRTPETMARAVADA